MMYDSFIWVRKNYEKLLDDYKNDNLKQENLPPVVRKDFESLKRILNRGLERERDNQTKIEERREYQKKYYQAHKSHIDELRKKYSRRPLYESSKGLKQKKLNEYKSKIDDILKELNLL